MSIKYYRAKYRLNLTTAEKQKDFLARLITKMSNELEDGTGTKQERIKMNNNIIHAMKTLSDITKNETLHAIEARMKALEAKK